MLKQTLKSDQISALKSGEKEKLTTLRYILSQIQNKEIDKKAKIRAKIKAKKKLLKAKKI